MRFGLFPGCNMPAIRPDVERAIRLTMPRLDVELVDLEGFVCCPAFGTFPSLDEDAYLALSAWNLSIGESKGVDLLVECGSCYSSLRTGRHLMGEHAERKARVDELLAKADKRYGGSATVRHISDVLSNEVGPEKVAGSITKSLEGLHGVVQYPCHSLFPSEVVGFEKSSARPHGLADLVEALGATVDHFSLEYQCCGGAGGFHRASKTEAHAFVKRKLDAIKAETKADFMVVSCITCLMFLDSAQTELSDGSGEYALPVFDYNQLLALCMGFPAREVAAISSVPRDSITARFG
jgi:heterodisulfide reductase subunit B